MKMTPYPSSKWKHQKYTNLIMWAALLEARTTSINSYNTSTNYMEASLFLYLQKLTLKDSLMRLHNLTKYISMLYYKTSKSETILFFLPFSSLSNTKVLIVPATKDFLLMQSSCQESTSANCLLDRILNKL